MSCDTCLYSICCNPDVCINNKKGVGQMSDEAKEDMVNHPTHYKSDSGLEVIDIIEGFYLNYHIGNVVKYILRAGKKGSRLEDLKKARWYLDRYISML